MIRAAYPGSFDPITLGHCDIIRRISPLYKEITILIAQNSTKKYLFSTEERMHLAEQSLVGINNIKFDYCEGLTVEYLQKKGIQVIVRGLRAVSDFEFEMVMANTNRMLDAKIETVLVFGSPELYYIASTFVKEIARAGGDLSKFVPTPVQEALIQKYSSMKK